ncbi:hypothetical protein [Pseudomonas fluorescens]|uniref:hypothetical protein n=1 Tax=Pseudomonas fluorescens TaxID=294 RepID=UPI0017867964|nr:hypothetical protein [Pseudomonas fluorescens]
MSAPWMDGGFPINSTVIIRLGKLLAGVGISAQWLESFFEGRAWWVESAPEKIRLIAK